jgi:hypothetical protein
MSGGETVIQRSRYMLAGQTAAIRVSGDPDSLNNGLFYYLTDHLGSASIMLRPAIYRPRPQRRPGPDLQECPLLRGINW